MNKKLAGLLGVMGALAVVAPLQAAPAGSPFAVRTAESDAHLLQPIPNALETLPAFDIQSEPEARLEEVQYYRRHNHHNYRRHYRRQYHSHYHRGYRRY